MTSSIYVTKEEALRKENPVARQNHSEEVNQETRRRMKEAKAIWRDRHKETDSRIGTGNSKAAFDTLKLLTP